LTIKNEADLLNLPADAAPNPTYPVVDGNRTTPSSEQSEAETQQIPGEVSLEHTRPATQAEPPLVAQKERFIQVPESMVDFLGQLAERMLRIEARLDNLESLKQRETEPQLVVHEEEQDSISPAAPIIFQVVPEAIAPQEKPTDERQESVFSYPEPFTPEEEPLRGSDEPAAQMEQHQPPLEDRPVQHLKTESILPSDWELVPRDEEEIPQKEILTEQDKEETEKEEKKEEPEQPLAQPEAAPEQHRIETPPQPEEHKAPVDEREQKLEELRDKPAAQLVEEVRIKLLAYYTANRSIVISPELGPRTVAELSPYYEVLQAAPGKHTGGLFGLLELFLHDKKLPSKYNNHPVQNVLNDRQVGL